MLWGFKKRQTLSSEDADAFARDLERIRNLPEVKP